MAACRDRAAVSTWPCDPATFRGTLMFTRPNRTLTRAHTLANLSIAAPVVVIVLANTLLEIQDEAETKRIIAILLVGLLVAGVICGSVALLAMDRTNRAGVIGRAVIGLSLGGLLLALFINGIVQHLSGSM